MTKSNGKSHPKSFSRFTKKDILALGFPIEDAPLFSSVQAIPPSDWLVQTLDLNVQIKLGSEKAKSEFVIAPIVKETINRNPNKVAVYSGYEFDVDESKGLTGVCDYIFSKDIRSTYVKSPIFFVIEAKNESLEAGLAQCIAEMYAAYLFNMKEKKTQKEIYAAVTYGREWQFYRFDGKTVFRDPFIYSIVELGKVLGVLQEIIDRA